MQLQHKFDLDYFITILTYTKTYDNILADLFEPQGCIKNFLSIHAVANSNIPLTQIITNVICLIITVIIRQVHSGFFYYYCSKPLFWRGVREGIGFKFVIGSIWWLWVLFEIYLIIQLRFLSAIKRFSIVQGSFTK